MLSFGGLYTIRGEQPLQLARTLHIETQLDACGNCQRRGARAYRQLHMQQQIEMTALETSLQIAKCGNSAAFVEHDKFDLGNHTEQFRFDLADDPSKFGFRPCLLQRANDGKYLTNIAERGEPQNTYRCRRFWKESSHSIAVREDNKRSESVASRVSR